MKHVIKGPEPTELAQWKEDNSAVPQNLTYAALHGDVTRAIRGQMLEEQGYLCAYTMIRTETIEECHIEHIIPQSQAPKSNARDIDYTNMLACFPGRKKDEKRWNKKKMFGAKHKDKVHIDATTFVSPLDASVEQRFHYTADGKVHSDTLDIPATRSIRILKLDHNILMDLRKAAIDERIFAEPLSAEDADQLAHQVMTPDANGKLSEFCLALSQVSMWYANTLRNI